jgi:hypothetical protein
MNLDARVHAIGWTGLHGAFGGKSEYTDMLPFPELIKSTSKSEKLSDKTIAAIKRLVKLDKIPRQVLVEFGQVSDAIAPLCGD